MHRIVTTQLSLRSEQRKFLCHPASTHCPGVYLYCSLKLGKGRQWRSLVQKSVLLFARVSLILQRHSKFRIESIHTSLRYYRTATRQQSGDPTCQLSKTSHLSYNLHLVRSRYRRRSIATFGPCSEAHRNIHSPPTAQHVCKRSPETSV